MSHIITAGCSFTNCGMSWPYHIKNQNVYNVGTVGAGNGYISRAAIWQCEDLLKSGIDVENIFLVVMWSGIDRFEVLSSNDNSLHKDYISGDKDRWWLSNYNQEINEKDSVWLKSSISDMQWENRAVRNLFGQYWKYFYSKEESFLKTLEYILRVQNYCEVKNIKYKFCCWQNIFNEYSFIVPNGYPQENQEKYAHEIWIMDWFDTEHWTPNRFWPKELNQKISKDTPLLKDIYPQTTHLWDMIDFDKFWFYDDEQVEYGGLAEWVLLGAKHNMGMEGDPAHPSEKSHKRFALVISNWIEEALYKKGKNIFEKPINTYGISTIQILKNFRTGSSSLQVAMESHFLDYDHGKHQPEEFSRDITYIVLIRDVLNKWKSGYYGELVSDAGARDSIKLKSAANKFIERLGNNRKKLLLFDDLDGVEGLGILHDVNNDLSWMYQNHAKFWVWDYWDHTSLLQMIQHKNIYFLELKDLSNPKFLQWLQEKDEKWKKVKEIPHINSMSNKFWPQMNLFWKEYSQGKILKDKVLACPFYDLPGNELVPEFKVLDSMVKREQEMVDYIRKNHERYLKL